ncbi:related to alfa-L-rhamnosidase [Cephalotrichum gorgonifer]|uniref:alpha-L-rhamnosidase n=1 Tax=Cephalotrichum gorgonifer TaxID=2041049 RepID=A0AAE8SY59_9PEZI|nr:related to alfa-L-rhamnosidase [Cephalotrichum gorgonifer]
MATITDVRFEHYHPPHTLGVQESRPRLSWNIQNAPADFKQAGYQVELSKAGGGGAWHTTSPIAAINSTETTLVPWPFEEPLKSRQRISIRVRIWDENGEEAATPWSEPAFLEVGLLDRSDWNFERIAAPWANETIGADAEHIFKREFALRGPVELARLYITTQGVYEAEINGERVGDYFMAPGWTTYSHRFQYQTYDVTSHLSEKNCLRIRVAEGWFCGRIGFDGGHRNIWGPHPALMAQLELTYADGRVESVCTDGAWRVTRGPIRLAEIYDGEKYDATLEVPSWSTPLKDGSTEVSSNWDAVVCMAPLPDSTELTAGFGEPVRRIETIKPVEKIRTPSGKTILDFGQNLVGYLRLRGIKGPRGHKITLSHAEVIENGELGTRPLRICKAVDEYTVRGDGREESYEPRFTFHGFRYAQIDGWIQESDLYSSIEAVVCHTDMKSAGSFSCSEPLLNKLYENIRWGMRGNFLSVPTDCPQRDERLGWSGDLALFAPTAVLIYDCFGMLKNWLIDLEHDQNILGGVPPMVSPNATLPDPVWCRRVPCAIWHDVTILGPWALYQETGDISILAQQWNSMITWMKVLPRNKSPGATHLWDNGPFQLGDWLDPAAPPDQPWKSPTDARMVANMFLIQSLDLISRIAAILGKPDEASAFKLEKEAAQSEFHQEYVSSNGRIVSDTQAAYALAICLDILTPKQKVRAGNRLVELARKNNFRIATGFAGTPFVCEALASTGHVNVAYAMLLETGCPSWLYPVTMGATTVWERWDSILPDGSINPGEMTSFNHYAFGAVAKFMYERIAGLRSLEPGWRRCRVEPALGAEFVRASASHVTPRGRVSCEWEIGDDGEEGSKRMVMKVSVPYGTTAEIVMPEGQGERREAVGAGEWEFRTNFKKEHEWPCDSVDFSCTSCRKIGQLCTFFIPPGKRGPRGRPRRSIIAENNGQPSLSDPQASISPPAGQPHNNHSPTSISSHHGPTLLELWNVLSEAVSEATPSKSLEAVLRDCTDLFFDYLHHFNPAIDEAAFRQALNKVLDEPSDGSILTKPEFTLITAVCAKVCYFMPSDIIPEGKLIAEPLLNVSRTCQHSYVDADLENPSADSITIRYLHSNCLHTSAKPSVSWHVFGDAIRLVQRMRLHDESTYSSMTEAQADACRKAFWQVYIGDKSLAVLRHMPVAFHDSSFEGGITAAHLSDEKNKAEPGFNACIRLWQFSSDLLMKIRLIQANSSANSPGPPLTPVSRMDLCYLYVRFATCLDDLPPYLQPGGGMFDNDGNHLPKKCIVRIADLQVTYHCLKMYLTQKLEEVGYFEMMGESGDMLVLKKTEIARDMARFLQSAPFWSLQVNGEPCVEKIRLVGAVLLAIIQGPSQLAERARRDFNVLLDSECESDSGSDAGSGSESESESESGSGSGSDNSDSESESDSDDDDSESDGSESDGSDDDDPESDDSDDES